MKISQYVAPYLRVNAARGEGKGLTIGSYLAGELKGTAAKYSDKYATALENGLIKVGARQGKSKLGRTAWYPAS